MLDSNSQTSCPLRDVGVELRDVCASCQGTPDSDQLRLKRREVLYVQGWPARHVYALVEGCLRENVLSDAGEARGVRIVRPGEVLGTEAFLHATYRTTVDALTDSRVCKVPSAAAETFLAEHPPRLAALNRVLVRQGLELRDVVGMLGSMPAEERVMTMLQNLVREYEDGSWVRLPVTRADMAELLGLAHTTVSRIIQRLVRRGEIETRGRWVRLPPELER